MAARGDDRQCCDENSDSLHLHPPANTRFPSDAHSLPQVPLNRCVKPRLTDGCHGHRGPLVVRVSCRTPDVLRRSSPRPGSAPGGPLRDDDHGRRRRDRTRTGRPGAVARRTPRGSGCRGRPDALRSSGFGTRPHSDHRDRAEPLGASLMPRIQGEQRMDVHEVLNHARDAMTVKRVFGDPYEKDGVTVIPSASSRSKPRTGS